MPDVGVPSALPVCARFLAERIPPERIERLWVFPPRIRGRREQGLLVAAARIPGEDHRALVATVRWTAEETGRGVRVDPEFREEAVAPREALPRVIDGVVRRAEKEGIGSDPELLQPDCDPGVFLAWLSGREVGVAPRFAVGA